MYDTDNIVDGFFIYRQARIHFVKKCGFYHFDTVIDTYGNDVDARNEYTTDFNFVKFKCALDKVTFLFFENALLLAFVDDIFKFILGDGQNIVL